MIYRAQGTVHYAAKKNSKAWKPWIQALGSFSQAKAWGLQGSVECIILIHNYAFEKMFASDRKTVKT